MTEALNNTNKLIDLKSLSYWNGKKCALNVKTRVNNEHLHIKWYTSD